MSVVTASDPADRTSLSDLTVCRARELAALTTNGDIIWCIPVAEGGIEVRFERPLNSGNGLLSRLIHQVSGGAPPVNAGKALEMILDQIPHHFLQTGPALADRVRHSRSRIQSLIADRMSQPDPAINYLSAEQELSCGHWMKPSPKSLIGRNANEECRMTPQWRAAVELVVLSVAEDLLETGICWVVRWASRQHSRTRLRRGIAFSLSVPRLGIGCANHSSVRDLMAHGAI